MIIESNKNIIQSESFGDFESLNVGISESDMGFLYDILSNKLYSDPISSVVREITSNCLDAHVGANKPENPIIISLYRKEEVMFISFKDEGTGMSEETFSTVYLNYLKSTKRQDNLQLGGFGLGSKTPFAVSSFYYLTTRFDGIQYTYLMSRENQKPEPVLISKEETSEPNGTIIEVPILEKELNTWIEALKTQLRYFDSVFIVNNLTKYTYHTIENDYKIIVGDKYKIRFDNFGNVVGSKMHIVIDKVYYPIDFEKLGMTQINIPIGVLFQIGEIQVTPNRELVDYSHDSVIAIKQRIIEALEELNNFYEKNSRRVDNLSDFDYLQQQEKIVSFNNETSIQKYKSYCLHISKSKINEINNSFKENKDYFKNHYYGPLVDNFKNILPEKYLKRLSESMFYNIFNYKTTLYNGSKDKSLHSIDKNEKNPLRIGRTYNKQIILMDSAKDDLRKNLFIKEGIVFGICNIKDVYKVLNNYRKNDFSSLKEDNELDFSITNLVKLTLAFKSFLISELKKNNNFKLYSEIIVPEDFGKFKKEKEKGKDVFKCAIYNAYNKEQYSLSYAQLLDERYKIIIYCLKDEETLMNNTMSSLYSAFTRFAQSKKHFDLEFRIMSVNKGTAKILNEQKIIKHVYHIDELKEGKFKIFNSICKKIYKSILVKQEFNNCISNSWNKEDIIEPIFYFLNENFSIRLANFINDNTYDMSKDLFNNFHFSKVFEIVKEEINCNLNFMHDFNYFSKEVNKLKILNFLNYSCALDNENEFYDNQGYNKINKIKRSANEKKKENLSKIQEFIVQYSNGEKNSYYDFFIKTMKDTGFKLDFAHYIILNDSERKSIKQINK